MMGIVTNDDDFQAELDKLNSNKTVPSVQIIEMEKGGRNQGDNNVPQAIREIIAEESIIGTTTKELAKVFPISASSVNAYKHGATSTDSYNQPQTQLLNKNNSVKDRIVRRASKKLMGALNSITDEKLEALGAEKASGVARDMSQIIRNMEPEQTGDNNIQNNIIYYSPRMRTEDDFESIQLNEL